MSEPRSLSRRSALAGLGVGSLGFFARQVANAGESAGSQAEATSVRSCHPLAGLWLSHIAISAEGDQTAAAPAFFGADGTAVLVYPCAEASENGIQIRGLALGTWAPIDDHEARFTAVQVCFGADGTYQGTRTYDGYPVVSDDGASFEVKGELDLMTVRDAGNAIIGSHAGARRSMFGSRMAPGNAGFTPYRTSLDPGDELDPGAQSAASDLEPAQAEGTLEIPEVAPVYPGDPRLHHP